MDRRPDPGPAWRLIVGTASVVAGGLELLAHTVGAAPVLADDTVPAPAGDPLVPFLAAIVATAVILVAVFLYARRLKSEATDLERSSPADLTLWACASCGQANVAGRSACFACQTPRANP